VDGVPVEVPTSARNGWVITARRLFEDGGASVFAGGRGRTASVPAASENARPSGRRRGAAAVVICTPNNPTGAVVPPIELRRIARECARRGAFLIIDRTYAGFEFERPPEPARLSRLPENVILIGSFSKVFAMTGWRVGYIAASAELIEQALKAQDTTIICAPTIGQIAVRAAMKARRGVAPAFLAELRRRRDYVQKRVAAVKGWSSVPAAGGFFTFIRIDGLKDSTAFAFDLLDRAHVLVMPGRIFGGAGEGHIRISFGVADVPRLRTAFDRIGAGR
ncbi:MAG TPA: pyridoxal phosphate-dependent aminotransferase, partial [Vicinamibacterales bacterium]|nr:pyridoxal phosphate-dependent aminotransferase [Vicinamibacterales bacterium]